MKKKITIFTYINSINWKKFIKPEDFSEKEYNIFFINELFSTKYQFKNQMNILNINRIADKYAHYLIMYSIIPRNKLKFDFKFKAEITEKIKTKENILKSIKLGRNEFEEFMGFINLL